MEKKNILIASHSSGEAITQCMINNKHGIPSNITIILLQELLSDIDIFDEVNDDSTTVRWYKANHPCISNTDYLLLNRVSHIPNTLFKMFEKNDREYAQRELEAYLGFAFNAFLGTGNKLPNGICENILSLPQQWNVIRDKFSIKVPQYFWGPCEKNNFNKSARLIYSSIYNFLNWSVMPPLTLHKHVFCFEKPIGEPVFILSIGRKQLITSSQPLSRKKKDQITQLAREINLYLQYFICEILIFIEGPTITFGCINADIIKSRKNILFDNFVCDHLINEFHVCIN